MKFPLLWCPRSRHSQILHMCSPTGLRCIDVLYRRNGGGTWRGILELYLSSCNHLLMHSWHSSEEETGIAGSSTEADQWAFNCHYRGCFLALPLGTNCSRQAMWAKIYWHIFTGRDKRWRNFLVTSRNLIIQEYRVDLSLMESTRIPRCRALLVGLRSYFSQLMKIPWPDRAKGGAGERPIQLWQANCLGSEAVKFPSIEPTLASGRTRWCKPAGCGKVKSWCIELENLPIQISSTKYDSACDLDGITSYSKIYLKTSTPMFER